MADRPSAQERANEICRDIAEFPDRTSPDECTLIALLVTPDELAPMIVAAITEAEEAARREAIEECANLVEQQAALDDDTDLGNATADAFNALYRHPMNARLLAYSAALAVGLRALATPAQD